jgi:hypothetical protein
VFRNDTSLWTPRDGACACWRAGSLFGP